jgi:hypothetical protein
VRAGLYGGGKDKSTGLASRTEPCKGAVKCARRLWCGKKDLGRVGERLR